MTIPYGQWPSPISATDVAAGGVSISFPRFIPTQADSADEVWWTEGRPTEGGRQVVVRRDLGGEVHDALPAPWNARTRVHEYGGASWLATADALIFAEFSDQRLWALVHGTDVPIPLTPAPAEPCALRYADLVVVGGEVWCVRERYTGGAVERRLVAVPLDATMTVRELVGGSDFLAHPRVSPDGRRLAWLAWDHPRMPWDGTEVRVADIRLDGTVGVSRSVLGATDESVLQPEWADADHLYAVTDRSGWWNLVRVAADGGAPEPLHPLAEEFGGPLWQLGQRSYALLDDGHVAVLHGTGRRTLGVLDPARGSLVDLDIPFTYWSFTLSASGRAVVGVAASPSSAPAVVVVALDSGAVDVVRSALDHAPDPAWLPVPTEEALPGPHGRIVHALVYPPRHPDATAPPEELPPYIVVVHGGPTSQATATLDMETAFFTSRGIGVLDVNYGGSSGYGREYRNALREQWGVVDVEDCVAAAEALAAAGRADGQRLVIRGGSAGGWTVLAALTRTDSFAAGASYFGVAELLRFADDTHDFESRYLDGLIGPLPQARERYVERAPLSHVDELSCPVLLLQGADDKVVPPSQSELFRDAMARKHILHAYLLFEGEGHGFRKAETIATALNAELSFYGQVLGFDPPGVDPILLTDGAS